MSEWREIWKTAIEENQNAVLDGDVEGVRFRKLREREEAGLYPFKDDKMVDFEEGITYECLKEYDKAIAIYTAVSAPDGLPVKHWRHRASLFLERAKLKRNGALFSEAFGENYINQDLSEHKVLEKIQWDAFYELHAMVNLSKHIRYLAISSMSRIDSEPDMAIVIFRTCLEDILKSLYPIQYGEMDKQEKQLGWLICQLFSDKKLFTKKEHNSDLKKDLCYIIKERGNDAAHGAEVDYTNRYLSDTIIKFIEIMKEANMLLGSNNTF